VPSFAKAPAFAKAPSFAKATAGKAAGKQSLAQRGFLFAPGSVF